ncbi:hypothetical protein KGO5_01915 [Sinorhizobium sp. KGO-5]|uniref:hypothetical protein n=1 Tax=Sinorhizobium sp. KGO-5 TaxID=1470810 RepID=UPI002948D2EF|nr:hypothetical protein KGO5_01915 [Sinorhizobium sp. KGO-5]
MNWLPKGMRRRRDLDPRRGEEGGVIVGAAGLIALMAAITLGIWAVDDLEVGAQAGAVVFLTAWSAFGLYAANPPGAKDVRLLPSIHTCIKLAPATVAACGVLWLAAGGWE